MNEAIYLDLIQKVTELFLNARIDQLRCRLELDGQTWEQMKLGTSGKQVVSSVIKLVRIGAFFKYIALLPTFSNSKI